MKKNAEIQWLRSIAIIFVLVTHLPAGLFPHQTGAHTILLTYINPATGVDLFFVISGFIIGKTFVNHYDSSDSQQKLPLILNFYVRRFYRLYPASVLWISLTLILGIIFHKTGLWLDPLSLFKKFVASIVSVRNFEESAAPTHLGYYWSLSVENQFYFLLPFLLWFIPIKLRIQLLLGLCLIFMFYRPGGANWWIFRFDGLLYGVLIYYLTQSKYSKLFARLLPTDAFSRFVFLGFFLLLIIAIPVVLERFYPLAYSLVCWGSAILVFAASLNKGVIFMPKYLVPIAEWIGERSYSLYLCHIPVFLVIRSILVTLNMQHDLSTSVLTLINVAAAAIFAHLTYQFLEKPLQETGRKKAKEMG